MIDHAKRVYRQLRHLLGIINVWSLTQHRSAYRKIKKKNKKVIHCISKNHPIKSWDRKLR